MAAGKHDTSRVALQLADVIMGKDRLQLHIRRSKTDRLGKGAFISLRTCSVLEICPVRALEDYLKKMGEDQGYLFCHSDGTPLTNYQVWKVTGAALERVGLAGWHFGTHSFCIGAASTAAMLGYGPEEIRKMGRWSSHRYKLYVRDLPQL